MTQSVIILNIILSAAIISTFMQGVVLAAVADFSKKTNIILGTPFAAFALYGLFFTWTA